MANPLVRAHAQASLDTQRLGVLFSRLGNRQNYSSPILEAYKTANYALREIVKNGGKAQDVKAVFTSIRAQIKPHIMGNLEQARADGAGSAYKQLSYYGYQPRSLKPDMAQTRTIYKVVDAKLNGQETALTALLLGGADQGMVLGDQSRQGVLRPFEVITTAVFWLAWIYWEGFSSQASLSRTSVQFGKQVVAALDHRTTDCCLRAHGQVVDLERKFKLTGTPRFADELEWTPFHHFCRSSVVLYLPGYDDGLTGRMRESAQKVIEEREAGINRRRRPADAFL
jgi:hypothetical protein